MTIVPLRSTLHEKHDVWRLRKRGRAGLVCFKCFESFQKQASLGCS